MIPISLKGKVISRNSRAADVNSESSSIEGVQNFYYSFIFLEKLYKRNFKLLILEIKNLKQFMIKQDSFF